MIHAQLIQKFYSAFAAKNIEDMIDCYHDDIRFEDPAFGILDGDRAKSMWRMLLKNNKSKLDIEFSDIETNGQIGTAQWTARYIFSQTGRNVVNNVKAEFEFKDGKIIKHTDHFDLYAWSRQAMGIKGLLMGWTPFFKTKLQQRTNKLLEHFIAQNK